VTVASQEDWLEKAGTIIQSRIERYAQSEIRFNLMAVIRDRRAVYEEELAALQEQQAGSDKTGSDGMHYLPYLVTHTEQSTQLGASNE